jgi:threonine dehydratase
MLGVPALIVMPADAPRAKIAGTRSYGAEVHLYDREREDRDAIAAHHAAARRAAFVPPFDDFDIIAGQGTAGLEIMQDLARLGLRASQVLVPCSGGGLTGGIAIAVKAHDSAARVVAVEPAGFDDMARSLATGTPQRNERMSGTICDALMMVTPGKLNFAIARELVSEGVAVTDDEVRAAMRYAFDTLKLVVEPGGAVGLAAVLTGRVKTEGLVTVVVLSGGNADRETMMQLMA